MKLRIVVCREIEKTVTPVPVPRHIVVSMSLCREIGNKALDVANIPSEVIDRIKKDGYIVIDDQDYALRVLGIKLSENEYIKISTEEQD